ncbi:hypothetical protein ACSX1A_09085 [Pontibacter sp. MBLB2868]|uniref:hypothetical protein n=1 Tax=Pontibacter sp. MBLB2868 TaxID=3451555 RepID=UPI003F74F88D
MVNSSLLISYGVDPENKLLYSKWIAPFTSEQYRAGLQHLAEVIHNNHIKLWIHESIGINEIASLDQKWTTEVLALILVQSTLEYLAIVRPDTKEQVVVAGNILREKAYRIFGKSVRVEFFDSTEEAKAWLIPKRQYYKLPALSDPSQKID